MDQAVRRYPPLPLILFFSVCLVLASPPSSNTREFNASPLVQAAPLRIGDGARRLTDGEIADIVQAAGGKPWLLEGPVGQIGGSIVAYIPPETETEDLRRGTTITMVRREGESRWIASSLRIARPGLYAQVKLPGRDFNTITGDDDLNRPFSLSGTFDATELVSLVGFIRTSPSDIQGGWPIEGIFRRDNGAVDVRLNHVKSSARMAVRLRQRESAWIIESARIGRP